MESLLALSAVATVIAFCFFYPSVVQQSRECSVFKIGRMVALGGVEIVTLVAWNEPIYPIMVLLFLVVAIVVFLLNKRDAKSWWHGILMTLWQSLVFIAVICFLIDFSNSLKRMRDKH